MMMIRTSACRVIYMPVLIALRVPLNCLSPRRHGMSLGVPPLLTDLYGGGGDDQEVAADPERRVQREQQRTHVRQRERQALPGVGWGATSSGTAERSRPAVRAPV
jgi:hypothetical protein